MASQPEIIYKLTCYADKDYGKCWDDIPKEKQKHLGLYGRLPCEGTLKMGTYCWNCQLCGRELKGFK